MRAHALLIAAAVLSIASCQSGNSAPGRNASSIPVPPSVLIGPIGGGTAASDGGAPVSLSLLGTVTFDRLAVTAAGLDPSPVVQPCRGVLIEVVAHNSIFNVLASTSTDAAGAYSIGFTTTQDFYVRARAESGTAPEVERVFHPETVPLITYAVRSSIRNRSLGTQTVDLHATHQVSSYGYRAVLPAGPFAILDTMQEMRSAASGVFPAMGTVDGYWAAGGNYNYAGEPFLHDGDGNPVNLSNYTYHGLNGPHGNPSLYVKGGSVPYFTGDSDHDEFDETVIARHWAGLMQMAQSRDNAFGTVQTADELVPNDAYSLGIQTALGCALLGETVYRDTYGYPGGVATLTLEFDCESGSVPGGGTGYDGGYTVARVIWDLLDGGAGWPADTDADSVTIASTDFATSFTALAGRGDPYRVAWLPSLLQQLIDDAQLTPTEADNLMQGQGESFPPPGGADPWPAVITLGGAPVSATVDAGATANKWLGPPANAVYRLDVPTAQTVTFALTRTTTPYIDQQHHLNLRVYDMQQNRLIWIGSNSPTVTAAVNLAAGNYVVQVVQAVYQATPLPSAFTLSAQ